MAIPDKFRAQSELCPLKEEKTTIRSSDHFTAPEVDNSHSEMEADTGHEQQSSALKLRQAEYIKKMTAGLTAAVLAMDHLLGPNWFRADPDDITAMQACLDGLDAYQMLASEESSPPPKRVLNFITQRVKLDGYLRDGITDICGCAEVIEDGGQLCHFHRQHYFAYRQKANPATMLRVQQWAQKRRIAESVWATKGAVR